MRSFEPKVQFRSGSDQECWSDSESLMILMGFGHTELVGKNIEKLLKLVRRADVTNKKDKVYGIMALLDDAIANQIQPDYSKSATVQQVYQSFIIAIITATKSLDQILFGGSCESGWPTWVSDLRTPFQRLHVKQLRQSRLHDRKAKDGKLQEDCEFEFEVPRIINGTILVCKGYDVSTIKAIGAGSECPNIVQWNPNRTRYGERTSEALARTLLLNHTRSKNPLLLFSIPWKSPLEPTPSSTDAIPLSSWNTIYMTSPYKEFNKFRELNKELIIGGKRFADLFSFLEAEDVELKAVANHLRWATLSLRERRLVITENGYLGLAPRAVCQGDVLVSLHGCSCPVVLRPCGDQYEIVGECYVDRIMKGNSFESKDVDKLPLKEFYLW